VVTTKPALTYTAQRVVHGFLSGLRPGTPLHVFFAPGGCNASVVTSVIIPDYLPPAFTDISRLPSTSSTPSYTDVRTLILLRHCTLHSSVQKTALIRQTQ
jgi:hypothetical protein